MKEENPIGEAFVRLAKATNNVPGSAILLNAGADLRDLAEKGESRTADGAKK